MSIYIILKTLQFLGFINFVIAFVYIGISMTLEIKTKYKIIKVMDAKRLFQHDERIKKLEEKIKELEVGA